VSLRREGGVPTEESRTELLRGADYLLAANRDHSLYRLLRQRPLSAEKPKPTYSLKRVGELRFPYLVLILFAPSRRT
jgi:hypothetical protein